MAEYRMNIKLSYW